MSAYNNITDITDMVTVTNTVTDGYFGPGIAVAVWIVLFGFGLAYGRAQAITYSSSITLLILFVENSMGLVPYWAIIADLILLAVGIFMLLNERPSSEV